MGFYNYSRLHIFGFIQQTCFRVDRRKMGQS